MSDWTWEYSPDAEHVVGDLSEPYRRDVEDLARRVWWRSPAAMCVWPASRRAPMEIGVGTAYPRPTSRTPCVYALDAEKGTGTARTT